MVTSWVGEPRNLAPEEHDDLRWFGADQLADLKLAHPETLPQLLNAIELASS